MSAYFNLPLLIGLSAIIFAQLLKIPINYLKTKQWQFKSALSTGGMPSSHTAGVMALASAIGFETGFNSPIFAVATMLAGIVMYDATGIRYQAGQQAMQLNELKKSLHESIPKNNPSFEKPLKTLLGHQPIEVLGGAFVGALLAWLIYVPFQ